jgi:hypothetical protein
MITKEELIEKMRIEMPFHLPERIKPYIEEAMELYANQDKWISVKDELPDAKQVGEKVLLYRETNDSQKSLTITVYDTRLVKHCNPATYWMLLPNPPKNL